MTDVHRTVQDSYSSYLDASIRSASGAPDQLPNRWSISPLQSVVRSLYRKPPTVLFGIGAHPDTLHLKATSAVDTFPITTLFVDIENSTRLNLLYEPVEVFKIKNAFIRAAIEIVLAFDGHVHRIMGDAVMAFFGGKLVSPTVAAVDAVNCAAFLQFYIEQAIRPILEARGLIDPFGIRIGIESSGDESVLWSAYGFAGFEEVSATGLSVDAAAKLQRSAGRHGIALGERIVDLLALRSTFAQVKEVTQAGQTVRVPFLSPDLTTREGKALRYRQWLFRWKPFLRASPIAQEDPAALAGPARPWLPSIRIDGVISDRRGVELAEPIGAWTHSVPPLSFLRLKLRELPCVLPFTLKVQLVRPDEKVVPATEHRLRSVSDAERFGPKLLMAVPGAHRVRLSATGYRDRAASQFGVFVC